MHQDPESGDELQGESVDGGNLQEDVDDGRVELGAGMGADLIDGKLNGESRLVCPDRCDRVEGVGDENDAAQDRNVVRLQAKRVATTVITLVVVEDRLGDLGLETTSGHGESHFRMPSHQLEFLLAQRAGFAEDRWIEVDLADIVKDARQCQSVEIGISEPDSGAEVDRQVRNTMNMTVEILDDVLHDLDQYVCWYFPHISRHRTLSVPTLRGQCMGRPPQLAQ